MLGRILLVAVSFLIPACAAAEEDTGPAPDVEAIHHLIERYTKAVDTIDLNLLSQIWSHSPEVSFIYPLGEERGFDAIEQHVFKNVIGGLVPAVPHKSLCRTHAPYTPTAARPVIRLPTDLSQKTASPLVSTALDT
jgi:hypothetical protein